MKELGVLQRALASLYRIEVAANITDFVRALDARDPEHHRGEVMLVHEDSTSPEAPPSVSVCISDRIMEALRGASGASRFDAWCAALEGVSHFTLLAWRVERERTVSELDLELQADVDKYALGVLQRCLHRTPSEQHRCSLLLRRALFDAPRFLDDHDTPRGRRYRTAHRMAAHYTASLERRHLRHGALGRMIEELRDFYRSGVATRYAMTNTR